MAKDTLDKKPVSTDSGVAHTNGVDNMTGSGMSDGFPSTAAIAGEDMEITRPKRSRARLIVPVVLVLAVAGLVAWWFLQPAPAADTAVVRRGTIISTVETTGKLQADVSASLAFKASGSVVKINVKQGDTVRAGQVLAQLESADLERGVQQAEAQLEISKLKLQQAQEGAKPEDITAATADLTAATAQLDNLKKGSRVEDIAAAQAAVNQAQAKLDAVKKGATAEDIKQAEATLRRRRRTWNSAKQPATQPIGRHGVHRGQQSHEELPGRGLPLTVLRGLDLSMEKGRDGRHCRGVGRGEEHVAPRPRRPRLAG